MLKSVIEVNNLVKKYNNSKTNAVDGVSFNVEKGEFFSLLGPNGAGKTTTISILTTTLSKTSGKVKVCNFDTENSSEEVRRRIGIIFQNPSLDLNLTAEENVRFHCLLYGLYPYRPTFGLMSSEYKKRIQELAEVLGIQSDLFKPIKTFSGGMKRKLEIVRSLMHEPDVLFLDEPTSGLDPYSRKTLWEYLSGVKKRLKTTIFLTTHYLDESEKADRVCIINHGKVVFLDSPARFKRKFIQTKLILDAKNRKSLSEELNAKKVDFLGNGPFSLMIDPSDMQTIISGIDTKLHDIQVINPTLEDAYLALIGENKNT